MTDDRATIDVDGEGMGIDRAGKAVDGVTMAVDRPGTDVDSMKRPVAIAASVRAVERIGQGGGGGRGDWSGEAAAIGDW